MIVDAVIFRGGRDQAVSVLADYDRPGYLGIRAQGSPSAFYIKLGDLDYLLDEARRAQPAPEGT